MEVQIICSLGVQQAWNAWRMLNILAAVPGDVLEGSFMHVHPGVPGGASAADTALTSL